jgi:hypothetical protein
MSNLKENKSAILSDYGNNDLLQVFIKCFLKY